MAKILLIEDDPLVVRMYKKVLSFEGFDITDAPNGREGLQKAQEIKPDLIFCDVMMPKMNGIEVLEHLKQDPELADIPVIMLTNLSGTHDAVLALKKGALAYMVKSEYKPKDVAEKAKGFIAGLAGARSNQQVATPQPVTQPKSDDSSEASSKTSDASEEQ